VPRSVGTSVERRVNDCSRYAVDLAEKGVWLSDSFFICIASAFRLVELSSDIMHLRHPCFLQGFGSKIGQC
jgi:hypothetical protein